MNKLLPKEQKDNIFNSILNRIRQIFFGRKYIDNNEVIMKTEVDHQKNNLNDLKVSVENDNKDVKKKEMIKQIANNYGLLEDVSTNTLKKILNYIIEENEKKKKILEELN